VGTLHALGATHLAILAAVPLVAATLAAVARARPALARPLCRFIAAGIAVNELAWYRHAIAQGWVDPPHGLPLDLCDLTLWLTVYALATLTPWALEAVYYLGLAGSGMALLTPDLAGVPFPSYPAVQFFLGHGAVVASVLFLVWTGTLRARPGAWWRTFLAVNGFAAAVALVNLRFGTNYMYLCEKPRSGSLLDLLGPWPWYVLAGEVVALGLLFLLSLPFRARGARPGRGADRLRLR
jgi:hypothetical integral membrane protein (TIGR02206 family)